MGVHFWGDEWFQKHGEDLNAAGRYIADRLYKKTRCHLIWKEKFGQLRYEWVLPPSYKNYGPYLRLPFRTKSKHCGIVRKKIIFMWTSCCLYRKWQSWGWKILWKVVQEAAVKWPELKDELYCDIAAYEEIVGKEIHEQYWRRM